MIGYQDQHIVREGTVYVRNHRLLGKNERRQITFEDKVTYQSRRRKATCSDSLVPIVPGETITQVIRTRARLIKSCKWSLWTRSTITGR